MFTLDEILKATQGQTRHQGIGQIIFKGISTDTRTIERGDLFVALVGERFDGHNFIEEASRKGAKGTIISNNQSPITKQIPIRHRRAKFQIIKVKDTLKALQGLAQYHRDRFKIPVVGVTGSCGKTTTKDMIASILSQRGLTLKNEENYNNEIGVPLTLLKLTKKHKFAVIEMAMQRRGELAQLAKIARPTIAVITNIGEAHLEFLKTKRNVARAKAEILRGVKYAVLNADDEYFEHLSAQARKSVSAQVKHFGIIARASVSPKDLKGIKLPVPGTHNIENALAAIAVAKILKIPRRLIKKGLEKFRASSRRSQIIDLPNGIRIINDCYNANPSSMKAALELLAEQKGRKIAVLGEMLELGKATKKAHRKIVALSKNLGIDQLFTFGGAWGKSSGTKEEIIKKLKKTLGGGDVVLIKGSRGTQMEQTVDALLSPE
jgi:UDP-N-acetylmuramoyl-tripeptide--D-alanyl-D-alanine ligase